MLCCWNLLYFLNAGFVKRCQICQISEYNTKLNNYIIKFHGDGIYNGKYMCIECFTEKIFSSIDQIDSNNMPLVNLNRS